MKRLFSTDDANPQEFNGMRVGDIICTYNAGYHKLDAIVRRFCTQSYFDQYHAEKADDDSSKLNVGDEYSPVFRYTKINLATGCLVTMNECDSHYCKPGIADIDSQIMRLQQQKEILKNIK